MALDKDLDLLLIMMLNNEYDEFDKIAALNGILNKKYFDSLTKEEKQKIIEDFSIGIATFNDQLENEIDTKYDYKMLPKVSGYVKA